jgi:hypothetical protein
MRMGTESRSGQTATKSALATPRVRPRDLNRRNERRTPGARSFCSTSHEIRATVTKRNEWHRLSWKYFVAFGRVTARYRAAQAVPLVDSCVRVLHHRPSAFRGVQLLQWVDDGRMWRQGNWLDPARCAHSHGKSQRMVPPKPTRWRSCLNFDGYLARLSSPSYGSWPNRRSR